MSVRSCRACRLALSTVVSFVAVIAPSRVAGVAGLSLLRFSLCAPHRSVPGTRLSRVRDGLSGRCSRRRRRARHRSRRRTGPSTATGLPARPRRVWPKRPNRLITGANSASVKPTVSSAPRIIGVSIAPGHTVLTRIPSGAFSSDATLVRPITPCLAAVYAALFGCGRNELTDPMFTIAPPSPCDSIWRDLVLETERDALQVDGEDAVPFLLVEVGDRMGVGRDRGIVDRAVEPPVALDRRANHGLRVGRLGDVGEAERGRAAVLLDALDGRLAELRVDVAHEHLRPGGGEHPGGRLAHPHRCAGDDRDLAFERSCGHRCCTFLSGFRVATAASGGRAIKVKSGRQSIRDAGADASHGAALTRPLRR